MFDTVNITGFQSFGSVKVNPTELIINELKKKPHSKLKNIQKLNVTTKDVDSYINELSQRCSPKEGRTLNLHMGVGDNKVYLL
jgi:pyrrolidone-carboxylate peptidase